jgi:hypothetical protein
MTNVIVDSIINQLIQSVSDEVIRRLKADGHAQVSLEADVMQSSLVDLLTNNTEVRDCVRDIFEDNRLIEQLDSRITELEHNDAEIDADDDNFADQVRRVIRDAL